MEKIFAGIDISKERLDVSLRPSGDFFQVQNNEGGIKELIERLSYLLVSCIVMEASGGYGKLVFAFLSQAGFPCSGDSSSKYFIANIFAFKWQGKRLTMHRIRQRMKEPAFDIRPIFLCNPIFEHDGDLYLLLPKLLRFRFPLPHLISLNPPKFRWWVEVERIRTEIWLLPKGKDAFELSKWRKIAELPGEPLAVGDWDKDGRIEMFLRTGAIFAESPKAVLARLQGEKLQRVEWHLGQMKLPTCVLPVTEGSKSALFVGWNDGTIERVQW